MSNGKYGRSVSIIGVGVTKLGDVRTTPEIKDFSEKELYAAAAIEAMEDAGIDAHFHPFGEDHALILEGELTYDISFEKQIIAKKNNLVLGWTNYVHGYHNISDKPLHILIFATPENNLSVYNQQEHPVKNYTNYRIIEKLPPKEKILSNRVIFSSTSPINYSNNLVLDLETQTLVISPSKIKNCDMLYITFKSYK